MFRKIKKIPKLVLKGKHNNAKKEEPRILSNHSSSIIESFSILDNKISKSNENQKSLETITNKSVINGKTFSSLSKSFIIYGDKKKKRGFFNILKGKNNYFDNSEYENNNSVITTYCQNNNHYWLSDENCICNNQNNAINENFSPNETSNEGINNQLLNNSQYQFNIKRNQNQKNDKVLNELNLISSPSMNSLNSKKSHISLIKSKSKFSNDLKFIVPSNTSVRSLSNQTKNNSLNQKSISSLSQITPPVTPIQISLNKKNSQTNIAFPLTPENNHNSSFHQNIINSKKANINKPKTTNYTIETTISKNKILNQKRCHKTYLDKDTPPTPENKNSLPMYEEQKMTKGQRKKLSKIKKIFKKIFSPVSNKKRKINNKKLNNINVNDDEAVSLSLSDKNENKTIESLTSSSDGALYVASPEEIDTYNLKDIKNHKKNRYNSSSNKFNSPLGQYISKIKKETNDSKNKIQNKQNVDEIDNHSNAMSLGSKISSTFSSLSSSKSTISLSSLPKKYKKNGKRHNEQIVSQKIKKGMKEINFDKNKKYTLKNDTSWSTVSDSFIEEEDNNDNQMKLDQSEQNNISDTEKEKLKQEGKKLKVEKSWNDDDLKLNPLGNISTEVIEIIEEENLQEDNSEDWDTMNESNTSDYCQSSDKEIKRKEEFETENQSSTIKIQARKSNELIHDTASPLPSEFAINEIENEIELDNEDKRSKENDKNISNQSLTKNDESTIEISNEISEEITDYNLGSITEKNTPEVYKAFDHNSPNIETTISSISSDINDDTGSNASSIKKSSIIVTKEKLLSQAINSYKNSIENEHYQISSKSSQKPSLIPRLSNNYICDDNTNDNANSNSNSDNDNSSVIVVIDEPVTSNPLSTISSFHNNNDDESDTPSLNPIINNIDLSDNSLSQRKSSNLSSVQSQFGHRISNINNNKRLSNNSYYNSTSSRIPVLSHKTSSSIEVTQSLISPSTTSTNLSSTQSNIPELVTDISGYTSSRIPIPNSLSIPTTFTTTSSSEIYSTLLSSDIPKMSSSVSIGIIGGGNDSHRITSFGRFSTSREEDSENLFNSSLNEIDINQSSISDSGLTQINEFSPNDGSSMTNTESLHPTKLVFTPTKDVRIKPPPLPPKDYIYIDMKTKEIVEEENSYYESSETHTKASYYNDKLKDINESHLIKKNSSNFNQLEVLKIKKDQDQNFQQDWSVYSGSSLFVISPKEKEDNRISKFYTELEIKKIENKDISYLNLSKEFPFHSDQDSTEIESSYFIEGESDKPVFIVDDVDHGNSSNFSNIKNDESNYLIKGKSYSYKEYGEDTQRDMIYKIYHILSQKYDSENLDNNSTINIDESDTNLTLNNNICSDIDASDNNNNNNSNSNNRKSIDFNFEYSKSKVVNNEELSLINKNYMEDNQILINQHVNLNTLSLPPSYSSKGLSISELRKQKFLVPTQPLWEIENDIIKKEANMEYNKPFDRNQKRFSQLNSNYYNNHSADQKLVRRKYYQSLTNYRKSDYGSNKSSESTYGSSQTSYSEKENYYKDYHHSDKKGYNGIIERSISNIEEYNRSKNEIIIDQDIIDDIFTEKAKNDITSSASYYSVSRSSFDDIGLDFFNNEYNQNIINDENYNLLVGDSEKLNFYYLDAIDIYGINSNLRNNSDITMISGSSFKNPDFLLGSCNTIHASIDFNDLNFKNSYITGQNNLGKNHYTIPKIVDVALKVLKPTVDKQKLKADIKIINEWVCLQRFVPIYGFSTYFNEEVLVSQFYKNGSLGQYLTTNSSISMDEKEEFVVEIVEGLDICHSQNLVHGNLKPSNILLDEYYHALLSDFSTNHMSPENPNTIQRQWLAPELKEKSALFTIASDIYSLGLIIYYIFNDGIRYFNDHFEKSNYLNKDWPENIRTIIHHCLQYDPKDRWTTKKILNHLKSHYQFGSIIDKYISRKNSNRIFKDFDSNINSRIKSTYGQENDINYYNRYPKLDRFKKFNRFSQYYQEENTSNKNLQFAMKALKHSLYFSDWNFTQAMKLMNGSRNVPCNFQKAIQRLLIPCSEGHVDSLLRLGLYYFDGQGIGKNKGKAYNLWQNAVEIFPNRHALGGKYQQINKNLNIKSLMNSPSINVMKSSSSNIKNNSANTNTTTASPNNSNYRYSIKSPGTKPLYIHNNSSSYSYESLLQKKQNLRGFIKCNERTLALWKEVAERKFVPAYVILGQCYRDGILVESNINKALIWFKRAAHMNDINGCWHLARCYFIYFDDYQNAYFWLLKASGKQHAEVDTALGLLYYYGIGIPRQVDLALNHFQYAADLGNANAQYLYCECLDYIFKERESQMTNISSITLNEEKSIHYDKLFHYCSMAATQGHPKAQFLLGKLYLDGSLKFIKNDTSNYKFNSSIGLQWIRLSAENGYKKAKEFLIEIL
ncbi:hypothetical protein H8356DRAFT_975122 [Neocallimastix lanati (nom. inval.)]|nr:hypothetical protein H8356DRAFT_975122 [Neocallimastix sp. JGI-2020a]